MSAGTSFHYPQQELQQELNSSRRKVQVMEDTLHDLLEELQFIHRQAEQLQDQRGQVIHNALGDLIEERTEREVPSEELGRRLLTELASLDQVSYARFASVYRRFESLEDFLTLSADLEESTSGGEDPP